MWSVRPPKQKPAVIAAGTSVASATPAAVAIPAASVSPAAAISNPVAASELPAAIAPPTGAATTEAMPMAESTAPTSVEPQSVSTTGTVVVVDPPAESAPPAAATAEAMATVEMSAVATPTAMAEVQLPLASEVSVPWESKNNAVHPGANEDPTVPDSPAVLQPAWPAKSASSARAAELITDGQGSTVPAVMVAAEPKVIGNVLNVYTHAFLGCAGLLVRKVDLRDGGRFRACGLPAYNFCVVDSSGTPINRNEHATALCSLRLSSVIGGHIFASSAGDKAAVFYPQMREERGRFSVFSTIKLGGRVFNAVDQGDDVAAVFEHATGMAGTRLMHVIGDNDEGPARQYLRILAAPRNLLGSNFAEAPRRLGEEYRPHAVVAFDDLEQVVHLQPGETLHVGDAALRVVSFEQISSKGAGSAKPPVFVVCATVVGDDSGSLSTGDTMTRASS